MANYYVETSGSNSNSGLSVGDAFASLGYALSAANSGDHIYIGSGTFRENKMVVPTGVSIHGAGSSGVGINKTWNTIIRANTSEYFPLGNGGLGSGELYGRREHVLVQIGNAYNEPYSSRSGNDGSREDGQNQVIEGFMVDGEDKRLYGGFLVCGRSNVILRNTEARGTFNGGYRLYGCSNVEVDDFVIYDCGWSNFPSYSVGSFNYAALDDCVIKNGYIYEQEYTGSTPAGYGSRGSGGMKSTETQGDFTYDNYITRLTIDTVKIDIYPQNAWTVDGANHRSPNITIEHHNTWQEEVLITNCILSNNISLVDTDHKENRFGGDGRMQTRVIGNDFLGSSEQYPDIIRHTPIELAQSNCEIGYNYINCKGNSVVCFSLEEGEPDDWFEEVFFHHNVVHNIEYGWEAAIVSFRHGARNIYVYNNTIDFNGIDTMSVIKQFDGQNNVQNGWMFNNILINTAGVSLSMGGRNTSNMNSYYNCFYGFPASTGGNGANSSNDFAANPLFVGGGDYKTKFDLTSSSPLINAGIRPEDSDLPSSMYFDYIGSAPDVGAREFGSASSCSLAFSRATPTICSNGTFDLAIRLTASNPPATSNPLGDIAVTYDNQTIYLVESAGVYSGTITGISCGAGNGVVSARFLDDNSCQAIRTFAVPEGPPTAYVETLAIDQESGELSWTNRNDGNSRYQIDIYRRINNYPNWSQLELADIDMGSDGTTQIQATEQSITNPPAAPFNIPGIRRYRLQIGSYVSDEVAYVNFNIPTLTLTGTTDDTASLSFTYQTYPGDEADWSFLVQRAPDADTRNGAQDFETIATIAGISNQSTYTYTDTGLDSATTYQYRIIPKFSSPELTVEADSTKHSATILATTTGTVGAYYADAFTINSAGTIVSWLNNNTPVSAPTVTLEQRVHGRSWTAINSVTAGSTGVLQFFLNLGMTSEGAYTGLVPGEYEYRLEYNGNYTSVLRHTRWKEFNVATTTTTTSSIALEISHETYPTDEDLFTYVIDYSSNNGATWVNHGQIQATDSVTVTNYTLTGLNAGTNYDIRVTQTLDYSSRLSTNDTQHVVNASTNPSAPTYEPINVTLNKSEPSTGGTISTQNTGNTIDIENSGDGTGYIFQVLHKTNRDVDWTVQSTFNGGADTIISTSSGLLLEDNQVSFFRPGNYVFALNYYPTSGSPEDGTIITVPGYSLWFNPITVFSYAQSSNSITLQIDNNIEDEDKSLFSYVIERRIPAGAWSTITTIPADTAVNATTGKIHYVDNTGLSSGTTYEYRVTVSYDGISGSGVTSAAISTATTAAAPTISIVSITPTSCSDRKHDVTVRVTYTNAPGGDILITRFNTVHRFTPSSAATTENFVISDIFCDDTEDVPITVSFEDYPSLIVSGTYDSPAETACSWTVSSSAGACINDKHTLSLNVTWDSFPTTESEFVINNQIIPYTWSGTAGTQNPLILIDVPCTGQSETLVLRFPSIKSGCQLTHTFTSPAPTQLVTVDDLDCSSNTIRSVAASTATGNYNVERRINGNDWSVESTFVQDVKTKTITLAGLEDGSGEYAYRVDYNTIKSNEVTCIRMDTPVLSIGATSSQYVTLSWAFKVIVGDEDLFEYDIERSTDNVNFALVTTNANFNNYVDTQTVQGTTFYYRVKARHIASGTESVYSNVAQVTVPVTAQVPEGDVRFNISIVQTDNCQMKLDGFFDVNGNLKIPFTSDGTTDVQSVSAITLKAASTCCPENEYTSTPISLTPTSTGDYTVDSSYRINLNQQMLGLDDTLQDTSIPTGVYNIIAEVTYVDKFGQSKKFNESVCVFNDCNFRCSLTNTVVKLIQQAKRDRAVSLVAMYYALISSANCNNCQTMCDIFKSLADKVDHDCNC